MWRPGAVPLIVMLSACSATRPLPNLPDLLASERLSAADVLLRAGCLDCLVAAFNEYSALRAVPAVAAAATDRAVRAAILVEVRERELGIEESGYLQHARDLAATRDSLPALIAPLVQIANAVTARAAGGSHDDSQVSRAELGRRNRDAWLEALRRQIDDDLVSAYLWLGLNCAYGTPTKEAIETWSAALASSRDVPLIEMKRATCGNLESAALERMLQADGRFIELHYYLGIRATLSGKLNEAFDDMQRAYSWRPRWPTVTNALANLSFSAEEFDQ